MSPLYMKSSFIKKSIAYELQDFIPLIQLKVTTITYSHNTIKYKDSKLWNNLPNKAKMSNGLLSFTNPTQKWHVGIVCSAHSHVYNAIAYITTAFLKFIILSVKSCFLCLCFLLF